MARENNLVFGDLVYRQFEQELTHGDTVHIPGITNLTAQTKNLNSALTFETQTESNTDLIVNTWEFVAVAIETRARRQSMQDLIKRYAPKMGYALGLAIDDALAGLPDNVDNAVGTLSHDLTFEDCLRAVQYLDDANVPQEDRHWVISPAQKAGFMKLEQWSNADYAKLNGGVNVPGTRGLLGTWMGIPVHVSANVEGTNAAGHDNTLMHREAFALATQIDMQSYSWFDGDYFADKYATESLYGIKEIRDDHAVFARGA